MRLRHLVHERPRLPARDLEQQLRGAFDGARLALEIDAALESQRGIGMHAVGTRPSGHECLRPERRFEKNIGGFIADCGAQAPHDSGETDGAAVVCNDQRIVVDGNFLFVEQRQLLALPGQPRPNGTRYPCRVIRVQWLTQFEHDVIGDIDDRRDTAQPGSAQAFQHPQRGCRRRIDVTDKAARKTRATFGQRNLDGHRVFDAGRHGRNISRLKRRSGQRRDIPCDAQDAKAIAAVGRQVEIEYRIGQA